MVGGLHCTSGPAYVGHQPVIDPAVGPLCRDARNQLVISLQDTGDV
jgi:hypothetical protein